MFSRVPILRLVLAVLLPFLMAANALAMPIKTGAGEAVSTSMMSMPGCEQGRGRDPGLAAKCSIDCPLVCGAITPSGPVADQPLSRSRPPASPAMNVAGAGISVGPDYPPPR